MSGRPVISANILNKLRPQALKTFEQDAYFTALEKFLRQAESGTGATITAVSLDAVDSDFYNEPLGLTADCDSLTADNDYLNASME